MTLGLEPTHDENGYPVFSPGLRRLLTEGDSAYGAAHIIAINAVLRAEAERVAPIMEDTAQRLELTDLLALLEERAPRFGIEVDQTISPAVYWNAYFRELHDFSIWSVRYAFDAWERGEAKGPKGSEQFFPQPHQLVSVAATHRAALGQMRHRIRKALEKVSNAAPPERDRMSRAEMIAAGYLDAQGNVPGLGSHREPPEAI